MLIQLYIFIIFFVSCKIFKKILFKYLVEYKYKNSFQILYNRYIMSKHLIDLLQKHNQIQKQQEAQLLKILPSQITEQTIPMMKNFFINEGITHSDFIDLLYEMSKIQELKNKLFPYLDQEILFHKLCRALDMNPESKDEYLLIKSNFDKKVPLPELIKNIYYGYTEENLTQQVLSDIILQLKTQENYYDKLIKSPSPNQESVFFDNQNLQDIKQYSKELQQDLKQIPESMEQHKIKNIQLDACRFLLQNREQMSQIKQSAQQFIKSLELKHQQSQRARQMIFSGKQIRRNLKIIRHYLCGIDIQDVFRMIRIGRKIQLNAQNKDNIVILFMGLSKAGKTTLITRLMGYQMVEKQINGIHSLQPRDEVNQKHKALKIGYSNKSTTRYPSIHEVSSKIIDEKIKAMDSPGFQDTVSTEVEISNRITTIQALKKVKNLQIVIVINQKNWGVSGADIVKLAKTVSSITREYNRIKNSVSFVFNQFDNKFADSLSSNVKDLYKNIRQTKGSVINDSFEAFFKHLQKEAKIKKNFIDPKTLNQKQFFQRLLQKEYVQNPVTSLTCDIGIRGKQQINRLCERYKQLFYKYYSEKKIDEAQYCMKMICRMGEESGFQCNSDFEVSTMKRSLREGLETKSRKLNVQFQQLTSRMFTDPKQRQEKYKKLKQEYEELQKQIHKLQKIDDNFQMDLSQITNEVLNFYAIKMNDWRKTGIVYNDLKAVTIAALQFYKYFAPQRLNQIDRVLSELLQQARKSIINQFKQLKQENKISQNFSLLQNLSEVFGKNQENTISSLITQEFQKKQRQFDVIQLTNINIREKTEWNTWMKQFITLNQVPKLDNFLKFLSVINKYPKQLISQIKQRMTNLYRYIVETLPKNVMNQYEQQIKITDQDDQEQKSTQTPTQKNSLKQKTKKMKILINWMKFLNKIQIISQYHNNRLMKIQQQLTPMIEKSMKKFQKIRQAFTQNNIDEAKLTMRRAKAEFSQLKSLIQVTDITQLTENFNQLEQKLSDSYCQFINKNSFEGNLKFTKLKQLKKCLQSYKTLKNFRELLFIKTQNLQDQIVKKYSQYQKKISDPINVYLAQIKEIQQSKKLISISNLQNFIKYLEQVRQSAQILPQKFCQQQQNQIKQTMLKILSNQIIEPLDNFQACLKQNDDLSEKMVNNIQGYLKDKTTITKLKRAIQYLNQLTKSLKLRENFQLDAYQKRLEANYAMYDQLNRNTKLKMQSQQTTNVLDQLKKIFEKLKYIEMDQQAKLNFENFLDQVYKKLTILNKGTQSRKQQIIKNYRDNKFFEQQFLQLFQTFTHDKTENGQKNRTQFHDLLGRFRKHIEGELIDLKNDVVEEQEQSKSIIEILSKIKKFYSFSKEINAKFVDQFKQNERTISCLPKIIQFVDEYFQSYLRKIDNLTNFTNQQINQVQRHLAKIQKETNSLTDFEIKFKNLERKKGQLQTKSLNQLIIKTKNSKSDKLKRLNKLNNFEDLKIVDETFIDFYKSLDEKDQKSVKKSVQQAITKQIGNLKMHYKQNFRQYKKKDDQLNQLIKNLPKQSSIAIQKHKQHYLTLIQHEQNEEIKQVFSQFDGKDFNKEEITLTPILNLAKKIKTVGNDLRVQKIQKQFMKEFSFIKKQQNIHILEKMITQVWQNKASFQQIAILNKQIEDIQNFCLSNIKFIVQKSWKKIFKKYQQTDSKDNETFTNSDDKMGLFEVIIKIHKLISSAFEYNYIKQQNESGKIIIKLIEQNFKKFSQLINQYKKGITDITNGIINNKTVAEDILEKIQCLRQDLKFIFKTKQKIKKLLTDSGINLGIQNEFNQKIQNISQKVHKILTNKFIYYAEQFRNQSTKDIQKRINDFEGQLKFLDTIMNGYNLFNPSQQIQMIPLKMSLQEDAKKAVELVKKQILKIVQFDEQNMENDNLSQMINYVIKLFETIDSKPRNFMPKCADLKNLISQQLVLIHEKQKKNIQETVATIISQDQNNKRDFKQLQGKFKPIQSQIVENKDQRQIQIQKIRKKYEQIIKKLNGEEKQKKEKELQSQIKNKRKFYDQKIRDMELKIKMELDKCLQSQENKQIQTLKKIIKQLLTLKKLSYASLVTGDVNKTIDKNLKKLLPSGKSFEKIFQKLIQMSSIFAGSLIEDHQAFSKLKGKVFTSETSQSNNIQFILDILKRQGKINPNLKQLYKDYFLVFDQQQNKFIQKFRLTHEKQIINTLKVEIKQDGQTLRNKLKNDQKIIGDQKAKLLGKIFALWSISIAQADSDGDNEAIICYKAHAAQILGILIIICVDDSKHQYGSIISQNRLAEVKTGQGKSILLAGLSIYFALIGYQVDCACYSQILSKRDREDFSGLFQMCGVETKINYGIFQNVIRNLLDKKSSEGVEKLQDTIKEALLQQGPGYLGKFINFFLSIGQKFSKVFKKQQKKEQKNILIIDEIDVLFDPKYFGDTFNQIITLQHESITNLFKFIWKNRLNINYQDIKKSDQFNKVLKQFSPIQNILNNQIYGMIAALSTYEEQQYLIIDKRIMYKVQDTYKEVSYRYNTVYAYLKQHEKNEVSLSSFNQNMVITLCVSQFAYASLPQFYNHVVGVTGTLTCLPKYIKQYLNKKYEISEKEMYPIPSVYSKKNQQQASNRTIHDPIIVSQENHHSEIVNNMKPQFDKGRPILIFFRTKEELIQFYLSPVFQPYQNDASYLTEQHSQSERNERIRNSSKKSNITLFTNTFIRGIDFKLLNKKAKQVGGFHGIVTYLIQSIADYIQATGRIGRQGNKGSFIEIFKISQLPLLKIDQNQPNPLNLLKDKRINRQQQEKETCEQKLQISKKRHQQTIAVFSDPQLNQKKIIEYVEKKNMFPEISSATKKARMVFLIDATISMSSLFTQLKIILPQIFADVYETLRNKKVKGSLQIQISLYRNYNSNPNQLLQISTFDNTGDSLRQFIKNARVSGGYGNQAIEVGLQHANTLSDIEQIIIMGDARGNTKKQVEYKRGRFKCFEQQRIKKGYFLTTTEEQMEFLLKKKVKVNSFYLVNTKQVRQYFEDLSAKSGGKAIHVDITKKQSSNIITQSIVEIGLRLLADASNADALLQEYKQILKRRMG